MKPTGRALRRRLQDVIDAIAAARAHLTRGDLSDQLVFDAVRMRFVEIGEAVANLPDTLLATESDIPWREIVSMRHKLARHHYDAAIGILAATVDDDLPVLEAAVRRMQGRIE